MYAVKIMSVGVGIKAILMTSLVMLLGATTFRQSLLLVLVSSMATGVFALLVVMIQVRSERSLHNRIDSVETKIDDKADEIKVQVANGNAIVEGKT